MFVGSWVFVVCCSECLCLYGDGNVVMLWMLRGCGRIFRF